MSFFLETRAGRRAEMRTAPEAREFMRSADGWHIVHESDGARAGVSSHAVNQYTVLYRDEYVDAAVLRAMVERELGFDLEQLHSVYCTGGRIPSTRRSLRARIDARLLTLAETGANMDLFCRITGLSGSTLDRALARATSRLSRVPR